LEEPQRLLDRMLNQPPEADIIDYAIHLKETDDLIGCGMIAHTNRYNRRCMLGIGLGWNTAKWGKSYASKTLQASLPGCSTELGMNYSG
jgi:RimJ/RimL family protein N-acetyltransferase